MGDNVGDVAGMGADLFESYVGSIIAAATLAITAADATVADEKMKLAFMLPALGIACSTIGYFAVSTKAEGKGWDVELGSLMWALEKGMYVAAAVFAGASYWLTCAYLALDITVWYCVITGLVAGAVIGAFGRRFPPFVAPLRPRPPPRPPPTRSPRPPPCAGGRRRRGGQGL